MQTTRASTGKPRLGKNHLMKQHRVNLNAATPRHDRNNCYKTSQNHMLETCFQNKIWTIAFPKQNFQNKFSKQSFKNKFLKQSFEALKSKKSKWRIEVCVDVLFKLYVSIVRSWPFNLRDPYRPRSQGTRAILRGGRLSARIWGRYYKSSKAKNQYTSASRRRCDSLRV